MVLDVKRYTSASRWNQPYNSLSINIGSPQFYSWTYRYLLWWWQRYRLWGECNMCEHKKAGSEAERAYDKYEHYTRIKASKFLFVGLAFETLGPWSPRRGVSRQKHLSTWSALEYLWQYNILGSRSSDNTRKTRIPRIIWIFWKCTYL